MKCPTFLDAESFARALAVTPSGSLKNSQYSLRKFVSITISDKLRMSRYSCLPVVCGGHVGKVFILFRTNGSVVLPMLGSL